MANHLLVIDFDYWFPNPMEGGVTPTAENLGEVLLYDWGHVESRVHIEHLWGSRAHGFVAAGLPLPGVLVPEGGWEAWWSRFAFDAGEGSMPTLAVCDSNAYAGLVMPSDDDGFESVWLYDAHHDCGYREETAEELYQAEHFSCENWMAQHAARGSWLYVRYPQWKTAVFSAEPEPSVPVDRRFDDGAAPELPTGERVVFSHVLLCRSGAWVPSWCDDDFQACYEAFPGGSEVIDEDFAMHRGETVESVTAKATADIAALRDLQARAVQFAAESFQSTEEMSG